MRHIALGVVLLPLFGCASTDYQRYADIQIAQAKADEARYVSMARIADSGDTTTKVAAMFALHKNGSGAQNVIHAPKSGWEITRDLLGIFVPAIVQGYGIHSNQIISTNSSNNATALGISTNQAFVGMAGQIQAPAANVTTTTTLSGTGVLGNGSYNTDTHAVTNSYNPVDNSNQGNPVDNTNNSNQFNPITYTPQ